MATALEQYYAELQEGVNNGTIDISAIEDRLDEEWRAFEIKRDVLVAKVIILGKVAKAAKVPISGEWQARTDELSESQRKTKATKTRKVVSLTKGWPLPQLLDFGLLNPDSPELDGACKLLSCSGTWDDVVPWLNMALLMRQKDTLERRDQYGQCIGERPKNSKADVETYRKAPCFNSDYTKAADLLKKARDQAKQEYIPQPRLPSRKKLKEVNLRLGKHGLVVQDNPKSAVRQQKDDHVQRLAKMLKDMEDSIAALSGKKRRRDECSTNMPITYPSPQTRSAAGHDSPQRTSSTSSISSPTSSISELDASSTASSVSGLEDYGFAQHVADSREQRLADLLHQNVRDIALQRFNAGSAHPDTTVVEDIYAAEMAADDPSFLQLSGGVLVEPSEGMLYHLRGCAFADNRRDWAEAIDLLEKCDGGSFERVDNKQILTYGIFDYQWPQCMQMQLFNAIMSRLRKVNPATAKELERMNCTEIMLDSGGIYRSSHDKLIASYVRVVSGRVCFFYENTSGERVFLAGKDDVIGIPSDGASFWILAVEASLLSHRLSFQIYPSLPAELADVMHLATWFS